MIKKIIRSVCATLSVLSVVLFAGCAGPDVAMGDKPAAIGIQPTPEPRKALEGSLTLQRAIELAIEESDQMAAARASADVANNALLAAYDHTDPKLNLGYRNRSEDIGTLDWKYSAGPTVPGEISSIQTVGAEVYNRDEYDAAISFYPQNPFERSHRISAAGAENKAAIADVQKTEWEVSTDVRRLFAQLDCLQKEVVVLEQLVAVQEDLLKVTRSLVSQGQLTAQDMIKISQNYLAAQSDLNKTSRQRDQTRASLADYLNLPASEVNIVVDEKTFPNPDVDSMNAEELVRKALLNRSDLVELHWKTRAAFEAWRQAEAEKVPWVSKIEGVYSIFTSVKTIDAGSGFAPNPGLVAGVDDTQEHEWEVDFDITIPFFSWTMNHKPDLMVAKYRKAKSEELHETQRACLDVRSALDMMRSIRKSRLQYKADTASILFDMQKTLDNAESIVGLTPDQVSVIKLEMLDAERLKLESEGQFRLAFIRLEEVLGGPYMKSDASSGTSASGGESE
jgi:outer membrane protein TolC